MPPETANRAPGARAPPLVILPATSSAVDGRLDAAQVRSGWDNDCAVVIDSCPLGRVAGCSVLPACQTAGGQIIGSLIAAEHLLLF